MFWTSFAAVAKADQRLKPPVALQDCIESDPELRDKLLRIVNRSSAGTAQINDLAQAFNPFGVKRIQFVTLGISLPAGLLNGVNPQILSYLLAVHALLVPRSSAQAST